MNNWILKQRFYAHVNENIYIHIPEGVAALNKHTSQALKLNHALYGIKQAPHEWNKQTNEYL